MSGEKKNIKAHLFMCTKCDEKNSKDLRRRLKNWAKENHPEDIKVTASGCLGRCDNEIAAVVYPAGIWYQDLSESDEENIKTNLMKMLENR